MRSTFISSLTLNTSPRAALPRLQAELVKASQELTTGRKADLGLALGVGTGESVTLRREQASLRSLIDGNASTAAALDRTQTALDDIRSQADRFQQALIGLSQSGSAAGVLVQQGGDALDALTSTLNLTDGRRHLFGGLNSDVRPVSGLDEGPGAVIAAAFVQRFGVSPSDPQAGPALAAISAADMTDFIDTDFAGLFDEAGWSATWSAASSQDRTAGVSTTERIAIGANANEPAMRKLAMAYAMVATLGTAGLTGTAQTTVLDKALSLVGTALGGVTDIATRLGTAQSRLAAADTLMRGALDGGARRVNALEAVDPAEAKTRLDLLTTQIEMSYSLTARILKLSIMDYV